MVMVRQANQSLGQGMQDEINALIHTDLRQDRHLVVERGIHVEQTLILGKATVNSDSGPDGKQIRGYSLKPRESN
jgi:hypothetical protein